MYFAILKNAQRYRKYLQTIAVDLNLSKQILQIFIQLSVRIVFVLIKT